MTNASIDSQQNSVKKSMGNVIQTYEIQSV